MSNKTSAVVKTNPRKAVMIGCGFVGSASVFALMQSGLFSEIVLIDADKDKAEGEAMDISHGIPFARPMKIYAGGYDDVADAAIIVVSAGAGQKPGETRLDLVNKNVAIFKSIIPEIAKRNFGGILLIVANPVDILTQVAQKLSGLPEERVIGSGTVLDSARLKYALGEHLEVDSRSVHAFIVGEHGDSEVVAWSSANVSGVELHKMCEMRGHYKHKENTEEIAANVKNRKIPAIGSKCHKRDTKCDENMECKCQYAKYERSNDFSRGQLGLAILSRQNNCICTSLIFTGKNRCNHNADCQNSKH